MLVELDSALGVQRGERKVYMREDIEIMYREIAAWYSFSN